MRIALGQVNVTVGDLAGNVEKLAAWSREARGHGADLVCFPELAITGYPPEDLVLRAAFVRDNLEAVAELARASAEGPAVLVGFVDRTDRGLHNAAALLRGGRVEARYHKHRLPNYGVFDEERYFEPGETGCEVRVAGSDLGVAICEDAWRGGAPFDEYAGRVAVIPHLNASPYHRRKTAERAGIVAARARETGAWMAYVNAVGGQDELVFDGGSMVVGPDGDVAWRAVAFDEDMLVVDLPEPETSGDRPPLPDTQREPWPGPEEEVYRALVLGVHDYVAKNGFGEVVIGLSGGIDSSMTATVAADALGPESVRGLAMPSTYSSPESLEDAREVAARLGVRLDVIPIGETFDAYRAALAEVFAGTEEGVAEENLQARIRGNLLMALSNRFGSMVLATGNKSEMAVGYSTLYGDMAGGFAPLKDVPKTLVYELARWRNGHGDPPPIPDRVLTKAPSAELRHGQLDTDSLPPYDVLDPLIEDYVEEQRSPEEMIAGGADPALVHRVIAMIDGAEYKRRQAPPGVKITPRAFGRDRRFPITNAYRPRGR
ncbi:MAG: NAD+ synthase [Actinomycetota bacterium]|nr:NAD+ synthase [Actinomycetota bacterium]